MESLQNTSFARHGETYFLKRDECIFLVPRLSSLSENTKEIKKGKDLLDTRRKEVLAGLGRKDALDDDDTNCMFCNYSKKDDPEIFLFPLCKMAHFFICFDCLVEYDNTNTITECSLDGCEREHDRFAMDEYKKAFGPDQEEVLKTPTRSPQLPDNLLLTTAALPDEVICLTEQTLVSLEDIAVPENVFFSLLLKTKMRVRKNVSIFGDIRNDEDFLGVDEATRNKPFRLKRSGETATDLALENIRLIPQNSISCTLLSLSLKKTVLINIFPKLRISEYCEMETLTLSADKEEQVAAILAQEQPIYVGRVREMVFEGYAVNILTKIKISGDSEVKTLRLSADREEHVAATLAREQTFCVGGGRVKNMIWGSYAVNVLAKIEISEDCLLEMFVMHANEEQFSKLLEAEDRSIEAGRIRKSGFYVPEEIKRKLRYTLVDGERSATSEEQEPTPVEEQESTQATGPSQVKDLSQAEGHGREEETSSPGREEKRSKKNPSLGRKEKAVLNFSLVTMVFFWLSF
ncbi:MAG: uncharacterized protein A8A55_2315 [Amphiamblys sp. WSBS2006]|nr:MAG: uncharacterized protein A8A55_2315 [Amphiamblys sp. WSBS2006]